MSNLLVVFGATGQQGGSVVKSVLADPELSKTYKVRAITRDTTKPAAKALSDQGVEVVSADADKPETLKSALAGAHTVFALTATIYDEKLEQREHDQGKAMADAAVAAGAKYFIFSTLSNVEKGSGGKLKNAGHFDAKAVVEDYIRGLPIKSAFFAPGSFMSNFNNFMPPRPSPANDGTFAIANFVTPDTQIPLIDTADDSGKYVGAILADPDKYEGKTLAAATKLYSYTETAEIMSKATGKKVVYQQLPLQVFAGFLPEESRAYLVEMFTWIQDFGYYGEGTEEKVEWTAKQARGELTTLEQYLKKCPLHLE